MIKTFKHKSLEDFFFDEALKKIRAKHAGRLALILDLLDAAQVPQILLPRGAPRFSGE